MTENLYKLSVELKGHEADIRGVAAISPQQLIASASRDKTVRLWKRSDSSNLFTQQLILAGHNGFVNALTYVKPTQDAAKGLVVAAGQDKIIYIYDLALPAPTNAETYHRFLIGHGDNVCALTSDDANGDILSASWDKTAKVWRNNECLYTLKGHVQAVWAVIPIGSQILTGSADKTIKLWRDGNLRSTFHGHTDVVRALVALPESNNTEFASAGNDATIRLWSLDGDCFREITGHTSFIYSLVMNSSTGELVSSGEDRTVRIWKRDGTSVQTIAHPAISVWTTAVDENTSDIITGASDGILRVFTRDRKNFASNNELAAYEQRVASQAIPSNQVGDIKKDDVSSIDALNQPGKKDGEVKMVRPFDTMGNLSSIIEAHQWSEGDKKWIKIGDVVDAIGSGRKQVYQGKEYDYVFDIDVGDDLPHLKLPYNATQNPYEVSQKFINDNELPQSYLDQVAEFIIKNSQAVNIGDSGYQDPFTGASSYRPGTNNASDNSIGGDPFTGGSKYQPGSVNAPTQSSTIEAISDPWTKPAPSAPTVPVTIPTPFPQTGYVFMKQGNIQAMKQRIQKDNEELKDSSKALSESDLNALFVLMDASAKVGSGNLSSLDVSEGTEPLLKILENWPAENKFPALDFLRLVVLQTDVFGIYTNSKGSILDVIADAVDLTTITEKVEPLSKLQETNLMLGVRGFVNLFSNPQGEKLIARAFSILFPLLNTICERSQNKNLRLALITLFLNYAVYFSKLPEVTKASVANINSAGDIPKAEAGFPSSLLLGILPLFRLDKDAEVVYRALVTIGTIIMTSPPAKEIAKFTEFKVLLTGLPQQIPDPRIKRVSEQLIKLL